MADTQPIPLANALKAEYRALRPDVNFDGEDEDELYKEAHGQEKPFSALCISGGGIRSATFALGAIQGLAESGILEQFDYLSTVSGGGYIGGWLTAWVQHAGGIDKVVPKLRRDAPKPAPDAPDPIQHLREYNNYLTPKLGALSPDTWTLTATILRNILLNWLVLIPVLLFALMIPRLILSIDVMGELNRDLRGVDYADSPIVDYDLPIAAALLFGLSMINILRYLPGVGGKDHTAGDFVRYALTPLVLAVLTFIAYDSLYFLDDNPTKTDVLDVILWCVIPSFSAWLLYLIFCGKPMGERGKLFLPLSIAVLLLGTGTALAAWYLTNYLLRPLTWAAYVTIALPLLLTGFGLAGALFVGLSSHVLEDEDREWLSRGAAYVMLVCALWTGACAVVLLIPGWAYGFMGQHPWGKGILPAAGGITAWLSALVSKKGDDPKSGQAPKPARKRNTMLTLAGKAVPPLFLMLLAIGLSALTNFLMAASGSLPKDPWDNDYLLEHTLWWENVAWAAGFFAFGWLMARYININKFSLLGMYRDRLIRAYLGASNWPRNANKFIGFCKSDNLYMHKIRTEFKPFHVVNLTLNLVGGDRLAWQQRRAEPQTVSPLHCGTARLGYRESASYGGKDGISLGTAVAISGAAANPNMGYSSSPVIGFILTLFNLRLGAWLGNPGDAGNRTWTHEGPRSAVNSLVREAFGLTNDNSPYVNLSDGGHFENLAIYEMVRRRCHSIVVLDGGCDPDFGYEDLGNALRKIRIDMKIPIEFHQDVCPPSGGTMRRCATATIRYSAVDGEGTDGQLIYIKPMVLGDEPPDVLSYRTAHPTFPHESTADQWFDESQTESYRTLGQHTVDQILKGWDGKSNVWGLNPFVEGGYLAESPGVALTKARG
jgi:Patatin-like phospholipase